MIMMREDDIKIDRVLNEFRRGDTDKRLCLFMYYRELREEFSRIQEDDAETIEDVDAFSTVSRESLRGRHDY